MELVEGLAPPGRKVAPVYRFGDRDRRGRSDRSVLDGNRCVWLLKKGPQRGHRLLGLLKGRLHVLQMRDDQLVASRSIWSVKHVLELFERHLKVPEPAYGLAKWYLGGFVVAVSRVAIDVCWFEQPHVVVAAQCFHAQIGHPREVTDGQSYSHVASL